MYRYTMMHGSGDSGTLCTTQLQRRLYVLLQEWGLNGHLVGQITVNDTGHALKDVTQLQVAVPELTQVNDTHGHHLGFAVGHLQHTIAHDVRTGVYA